MGPGLSISQHFLIFFQNFFLSLRLRRPQALLSFVRNASWFKNAFLFIRCVVKAKKSIFGKARFGGSKRLNRHERQQKLVLGSIFIENGRNGVEF